MEPILFQCCMLTFILRLNISSFPNMMVLYAYTE